LLSEVEVILPILHPKQEEIINNAKRFNHLRCGRRFGKTTLIEELSSIAIDGQRVGIWFPTYKDLSEVWKDLKKLYRDIISRKDEQLKQITLLTEGIIDFWSMEQPDSGQGRKYHRTIIDEAAKADKLYQAWENTIRPTLTDYAGDAFIMSRPKGRNNDFYDIEQKHRKFDNWAFFHYTTYDNPYIDKKEIDEAKSQLDTITFDQEYLAEYVDASDKPFLYSFSRTKHTTNNHYKPNPHLNLIISFDFNKDPMTCTIGQILNIRTLRIFDKIKIENGSTPEVCDIIIAKYPHFIYHIDVTGDSTGNNRTPLVVGNINHYIIIKQKLQLKDYNLKVAKKNMDLSASRILCNSILEHLDVMINDDLAEVIDDCANTSIDPNPKTDTIRVIKTPEHGRHFFDNVRYMFEAAFPDFINKPGLYQ